MIEFARRSKLAYTVPTVERARRIPLQPSPNAPHPTCQLVHHPPNNPHPAPTHALIVPPPFPHIIPPVHALYLQAAKEDPWGSNGTSVTEWRDPSGDDICKSTRTCSPRSSCSTGTPVARVSQGTQSPAHPPPASPDEREVPLLMTLACKDRNPTRALPAALLRRRTPAGALPPARLVPASCNVTLTHVTTSQTTATLPTSSTNSYILNHPQFTHTSPAPGHSTSSDHARNPTLQSHRLSLHHPPLCIPSILLIHLHTSHGHRITCSTALTTTASILLDLLLALTFTTPCPSSHRLPLSSPTSNHQPDAQPLRSTHIRTPTGLPTPPTQPSPLHASHCPTHLLGSSTPPST